MGLLRNALFPSSLACCMAVQAMAQTAPEAGQDRTQSPYFFVMGGDSDTEALPLKGTSVKVDISGIIADVKVTQTYKNEGRRPIEAVYVFPGSTRAAVYGMRMIIGERVIQARIQEKQKARESYERAKEEGRSASLLEQQRPNVFQMNVANILPGDEIKVELSYTELLVPTDGVYDFVFPTVVGPRYSKSTENWVANPHTPKGVAPLHAFDLDVKLSAGMPIQKMACATHKTQIDYEGASIARLKLDPREESGANRDFILKYQLSGGEIQSGLLLSQGEKENFFLLMVQPPKRVTPAVIPAREYVFIVDVSGSMGGFPLETTKVLMRNLFAQLRPVDRFNILTFSGGSAVFSPEGSLPATNANVDRAQSFIQSLSGGGGTEILPAIKRVMELPRDPGVSRSLVIATDGFVSVEPEVFQLIREKLGDANFFSFGIGSSVNRHLMEGIAHVGMGEAFVITRPEEAAAQAEKFRQYIASPVFTNIKIAFNGLDAYDIEPLNVPDVLAQRPVICFGKWRGEAKGAIKVSGISGDGVHSQIFDVGQVRASQENVASPEHGALKYLWARHRIKTLADYGGLMGRLDEGAVTDLGLRYNLLTNYTSFIAEDSQVRTSEPCVSVRQPLPMPQGVSNSAIGGMVYRSPSPVRGASNAAATVEVVASCVASCAATSSGDGGFTMASLGRDRKTKAFHANHLGVKLGEVRLEGRGVRSSLRKQILAYLSALKSAGHLQEASSAYAITLRVDAKGHVKAVDRDQSFVPLRSELEAQLLTWCFKGWKAKGARTLVIRFSVNA